jgi:hypothetical protein
MGGPIFLPKPEAPLPPSNLVVNWRERMDEILAKIYGTGLASLSDEEKIHLQVYSRKCKSLQRKKH